MRRRSDYGRLSDLAEFLGKQELPTSILGAALNANNRSVGFRKVELSGKEEDPMDIINDSITKATYDIVEKQEDYLKRLLHAMNVSVQEFNKEYVLEVYPLECESYNERPGDEYRIRFTQSVRVRPKTEEEKKTDGRESPRSL